MAERTLDCGGVPTRVFEGASEDLLLFGHRGTLSKDDKWSVEWCRTLAEYVGLTVVAVDAPSHGARAPRSGDPEADRRAVEEAVVAGGKQAALDWWSVIASLGLGPAVAYVGFSMGAMHGTIVAAAIPTLRAAVFGMAGVPTFTLDAVRDSGSDTPHMAAARQLQQCEVLMVNTTGDDMFSVDGALTLFGAFPTGRKRLMLWEGDHGTEPPDMVEEIVGFVNRYK